MNKGFTLVELLVSIAILVLIVSAIYGILNLGNITFSLDTGMLDLQQQARQAMHSMVRELREAFNISITSGNDNNMIVFDTSSKAGIKYYRDTSTNQIIREYPSGTEKILANDIDSLKFIYNSPYVEIQLEAKKTIRQRQLSFPLRAKLRLRNE